MADNDVLTQLQTCYDQLATQMFASLSYLTSHHTYLPPAPLESDPFSYTQPQNPTPEEIAAAETTLRPYRPDSPETFAASQWELANDLVLKELQIEDLIKGLPGVGRTEEEQEQRIRELEKELREVEEQRKKKRKEVRKLVKKVDAVVMEVAGKGIRGGAPVSCKR